jgi:23S rRNA (guanosine2251-2'-O)-methyltransferase
MMVRRPAKSTRRSQDALARPAAALNAVIYGKNPVKEALRGGNRPVERLWVVAGRPGEDLSAELRLEAQRNGIDLPPLRTALPEELQTLAGSFEHQGVVAEVGPYPYSDPDEILAARDLLIALDRVQDPHNLGAVIRTADAAGAGVAIPRHRAAAVTPAVVKASAGATEHVPVAQVRNLADFLVQAKGRGFWIYGAAAGVPSSYYTQDFRGPVVFVLGSEGEGLSHRVAAACDVLVSLPLLGAVESLNVSVTAGVLLFEVLRQRALGSP